MRHTIMRMGPLCLLLLLASAGAAASGDETEPPAEPAHRITVTLSEYQFTPSKIKLKAGELVEFTLINEGTVTHEFITLAISNLEVAVTIAGVEAETVGVAELELAPKATAVLRFTPEIAGTYLFFCGAKQPTDHRAAGMTGALIVE
jgi:plastocyanin